MYTTTEIQQEVDVPKILSHVSLKYVLIYLIKNLQ